MLVVLSIALLLSSPLIAQGSARLSAGALYERIDGSSLLGVESHGRLFAIKHTATSEIALGGRAFYAGGGGIPGVASSVRHWGVSPIVLLSLWPGTSTRIQLFAGIGYDYYASDVTYPDGAEPAMTVRVSDAGLHASQSGILIEQELGDGWGVTSGLALYERSLGSHEGRAVQITLGFHVR